MRKGLLYFTVAGLFVVSTLFSGCSSGMKQAEIAVIIDETDLTSLAAELSHELLEEGIDTVAVVDFSDPEGNVTEFEQEITEKVFLAMAGFTGKLWVLSGEYLNNLLSSQEPPDAVWHVMGIKAVVYGTVSPESEKVILCLKVLDVKTAEIINQVTKECRAVPKSDSGTYLAHPGRRARKIEDYQIPTFPWPPPEASASSKIPSEFLLAPTVPTSLSEVARNLEYALDLTGYTERSYYAVPDGFALATRLEQMNPDGTSKQPPDRWAIDVSPPKVFSLASYLKAIFTAQEGHFRIITFIVTSSPFTQSSQTDISREDAIEWLTTGVQVLPQTIGKFPFTEHHYCVALIYEFEQATRNHEPYFKRLSTLPGIEHLKQTQLWEILEK